jgi:DNA repair exonuclease SbcCD ATPase subunit
MKVKHKLIQDFQFTSIDKKIYVLKSGTIIENYLYKTKVDEIPINKDIVDSNPEFFELIDWKSELLAFMKANKVQQSAALGKKLIPFIDNFIVAPLKENQQTITTTTIDISKEEELNSGLEDLQRRDRRLKDKEDEIDIRLKRVEKRENEYKEDLKSLDKKENDLRERSKELINKSLELDDKEQELKEQERNIDLNDLKSSEQIDSKYSELQRKLDQDMKSLSQKEKDLDNKTKELKNKELDLDKKYSEMSDSSRDNKLLLEEIRGIESDLNNILKMTEVLSDFGSHPFISQVHKNLSGSLNGIISRINNNLL